MNDEQERKQIDENIILAFVNSKITAQEAAQAYDALHEHMDELDAARSGGEVRG